MTLGRGRKPAFLHRRCLPLSLPYSPQPSKVPTPQLRQVKRSRLHHTGIEPARVRIFGFGRLRFSYPRIASTTSARVSYHLTGLYVG